MGSFRIAYESYDTYAFFQCRLSSDFCFKAFFLDDVQLRGETAEVEQGVGNAADVFVGVLEVDVGAQVLLRSSYA